MEVKLFDSIHEAKKLLVENRPKLVKAMGRNICVIRRGELITAFINECPHQGGSLHQGSVNYLGEIVCPLHSYRFSLTSGEPIEKPCGFLRFIPVIMKSKIYLEL